MKVMKVPEARSNSIEAILHEKKMGNGYILFTNEADVMYEKQINHRAIGVVYDSSREKYGNYVPSVLSKRYDALIYIDETKALHPLHLHADKHKLAATYPFNL
jgi:erythromycin esterase-like protein